MSENTPEVTDVGLRTVSEPDNVAHRPGFPVMTEGELLDLEDDVDNRAEGRK